MEIPRSLLDELTDELNALSAAGRQMVENVIANAEWSTIAELRDIAIEALQMVCGEIADLSAARAAEFYDSVREVAVGTRIGTVVAASVNPAALDGAVRALIQTVVDTGSTERFVREIGDRVDLEVKQAAGNCIAENARRDQLKPKFARVPAGPETCRFCIMLASRGFVYSSKESAGALNHYHPHCDCRIVPGFDGGESGVEGYDPDLYYHMLKHPEKYEDKKERKSKASTDTDKADLGHL